MLLWVTSYFNVNNSKYADNIGIQIWNTTVRSFLFSFKLLEFIFIAKWLIPKCQIAGPCLIWAMPSNKKCSAFNAHNPRHHKALLRCPDSYLAHPPLTHFYFLVPLSFISPPQLFPWAHILWFETELTSFLQTDLAYFNLFVIFSNWAHILSFQAELVILLQTDLTYSDLELSSPSYYKLISRAWLPPSLTNKFTPK